MPLLIPSSNYTIVFCHISKTSNKHGFSKPSNKHGFRKEGEIGERIYGSKVINVVLGEREIDN